MLRYIAKRLLGMIPVLLIISSLTFFMIHKAPGGPFSKDKQVSPEVLKNIEKHYWLDRPIPVQYLHYMGNVLKGDLGPSFKYPSRTVNELIADSFPVSLELGCYALLFAMFVGVILGSLASLRPNTIFDYAPMSLSMIGICAPTFVIGPILVLVFGNYFKWFNTGGWDSARDKVLPVITLGLYYCAYIARLSRGGMLEIMNQDFIRTARAKGASTFRVIVLHAMRGGVLPVVSFLGPAAAGIITGSFVVEKIFRIPGLGRFFVESAFGRDYTMMMGTVLFYAFFVILFNLVVDVVQTWLNPKITIDS
ncbi:MAG: Nickel-transporting ATPase [Verrucomicrobiales bacterium]|nr:Nickel-transporting ATPase [Verrucomicrobiales bacterium]MDB6130326.1 Nickel-transporting ATPase [Verrucomicrobiales bacterium]